MTTSELRFSPADDELQLTPEQIDFRDRHIAQAILIVDMDDPVQMEEQLWNNIASTQIDHNRVQEALSFMNEAHANQSREHRDAPYSVHTLGMALLTLAWFGEKTSTDQLVIALLHDTIEKGKLNDQPVQKSDIVKHFGEIVADGVDALSNVTDKAKLSEAEYCEKMVAADQKYPDLQLPVMKMMADRIQNYFDPTHQPSPAALKGRQDKLNDRYATSPFMDPLLRNPDYAQVRSTVREACSISAQMINRMSK